MAASTGPCSMWRLQEARRAVPEPSLSWQPLAQTELDEGLLERDPVGVTQVGLVGLEHAAKRAAAEHAAAESRALLEPKGHGRERPRRPAARRDRLQGIERREHAESPRRSARRRTVCRDASRSTPPRAPAPSRPGGRRGCPQHPWRPRARVPHPAADEVEGAPLPQARGRGGWCRRPGRSRRVCPGGREAARRGESASRGAIRAVSIGYARSRGDERPPRRARLPQGRHAWRPTHRARYLAPNRRYAPRTAGVGVGSRWLRLPRLVTFRIDVPDAECRGGSRRPTTGRVVMAAAPASIRSMTSWGAWSFSSALPTSQRWPVPSRWAIQDSNLGPLPYQRSALTD